MLVLSRRVGERVFIGETVVLTVASVTGGQVRLAFEAPGEVVIDRGEVRNRRGQGQDALRARKEA